MIVKCPISKLRPGMYIANPGLSDQSNPHVYLVEGIIGDGTDIVALSTSYSDTYIDTEQGSYFAGHPEEKADFESLFNFDVYL